MPKSSWPYTVCALVLAIGAAQAASHAFQPNEPVKLYANKVGPFSNPRCFPVGDLNIFFALHCMRYVAISSDVFTSLMCTCSETYQYYDLPFCRTPDGLEHKPETLGEVGVHMPATSWLPHSSATHTTQALCSFVQCAWCSFLANCAMTNTISDIPPPPRMLMLSKCVIQVVDGNRLMNTPYDLSFRADRDHVSLCTKMLTQSEIQKFRKV